MSETRGTQLRAEVAALRPQLVAWRRQIHRRPELGFQEHETSALVARELGELGLELRTGVARTGVVGLLDSGRPGPTLLVRADMDALPLSEDTRKEYASEVDGRMHACGHDGHVAMALGAARVLAARRERLKGRVKFVFQPAEEGPGGAQPMIAEGVLQDPRVDAAVGLHLWNDLEVGRLGIGRGPIMAATDEFHARVEGVGGHGAYPHDAVDPVLAAAAAVVALQSIVARNLSPVEPGVVTVGQLHAGTAINIIPRHAELSGTVRSYTEGARKLLLERVGQVIETIAAAYGARASVRIERGYPATVNDDAMASFCAGVARSIFGEAGVIDPERSMGAEDMSYYLREVPGCFMFLGSRNSAKGCDAPHHSPLFDFDEDALPLGCETLVRVSEAYLGGEPVAGA